jgi:hypothetical protein
MDDAFLDAHSLKSFKIERKVTHIMKLSFGASKLKGINRIVKVC